MSILEHWTPRQWTKVPLKLKQRWWNETNYGKVAPTEELIRTIKEFLDANSSDG